jgi:hypothetical protein
MKTTILRTALLASALVAAGCASTPRVDPDVARGRQQLVDAIDAGWIRVVRAWPCPTW